MSLRRKSPRSKMGPEPRPTVLESAFDCQKRFDPAGPFLGGRRAVCSKLNRFCPWPTKCSYYFLLALNTDLAFSVIDKLPTFYRASLSIVRRQCLSVRLSWFFNRLALYKFCTYLLIYLLIFLLTYSCMASKWLKISSNFIRGLVAP